MSEKNTSEKKVSYYRKPQDMSVDDWQIALRKQFAAEQNFEIQNIGDHQVYSDFLVYNPKSGKEYKVAIRDRETGLNFCNCPDFTVNRLGTCKHIEFLLHEFRERKYDHYWEEKINMPYSSVSLKYGNERKIFLRVGSEKQEEIKELASDFFDNNNFLKPEAYGFFDVFYKQAQKIDTGFRCYPDAMEHIISVREDNARKKIIRDIFEKNGESEYFKGLVKTELYPYQKDGVVFALNAGRVLLADDMGLGKTIQAITATEVYVREFGIEKVLIICPTSLKYQWKNEIEKFTDRTVRVIEGPLNKRIEQYGSDELYKIISYGAARNDSEYINSMAPDLVILDEAQRIKNWKTKTAQYIKQISSKYTIVLTGTPLENKLEELHSIVEYIDRYKLGALFRFLSEHQIKDEGGKVIGYQNLHNINKTLDDIMIRRKKQEILQQLPERADNNIFVDMTRDQRDIHKDYYKIVRRLVNKWRKLGFLPEDDRKRLMISLNCMRMVCDSTYILDQETRHDKKIDELFVSLEDIFEEENEKVVIFSQWERMTRLVARELEKRNIKYEYLHGGVPSQKRKDLLDNFHQDADCRVFLSTDAGGVGLNLQCASIVINLDLPWNPAVLEQRIGRVHRLGQKNFVRVINYISKYSIEERMLFVLSFKQNLFGGIFDEGEDVVFMEKDKFKQFMESIEKMTDEEQEEIYSEDEEGITETGLFKDTGKKETIDSSALLTGEGFDEAGEEKEEVSVASGHGLSTGENQQSGQEEMQELFTQGIGFISKLGTAINNIRSGKTDISTFVDKDPETGRTHLKIPVENEETVKNAVNMLGSFFNAFKNN